MTEVDWPALDALHEARRRAGGMAYPLWHALEDAYPAIRAQVRALEEKLAASDRALACASQMLAAHLDDVPAVEAVAAFVEMHGVFTEERELTKAVAAAIRAALAAGKEE